MQPIQTCAGIDVSAKTLAVCRWRNGKEQERSFPNDAAGHGEVNRWLGKGARVAMEATGAYHLQLAVALVKCGVEVMVVNPRVAKDFARALSNRSKTDAVDARALLEYVQRMEFRPWQVPGAAVMELRELGRRLTQLIQTSTDEKNRLHAARVAGTNRTVRMDLDRHIRALGQQIKRIEQAALKVIRGDADLAEQFALLKAAPGIGARSAILLLTELAVLDRAMTRVRSWPMPVWIHAYTSQDRACRKRCASARWATAESEPSCT